jgi:hypothetical protein
MSPGTESWPWPPSFDGLEVTPRNGTITLLRKTVPGCAVLVLLGHRPWDALGRCLRRRHCPRSRWRALASATRAHSTPDRAALMAAR